MALFASGLLVCISSTVPISLPLLSLNCEQLDHGFFSIINGPAHRHAYDKLKMSIREIFFSFEGGF